MRTGRPAKAIEAGQKYNMLTAIKVNGQDRHGRFTWECLCDCGETATVKATYLRTGEKKSCGCQQFAGNRRTHGHSEQQSKAYICWKNMKKRCNDSMDKNYGGRGITYDPRWESFENFLVDMGEPPTSKHSIDRRNNSGNYTKSNCRWTTQRVQRANSRAPLTFVSVNGITTHLAEAVRLFGAVSYGTVKSRIERGWPEDEAVLRPLSHKWSRRKK